MDDLIMLLGRINSYAMSPKMDNSHHYDAIKCWKMAILLGNKLFNGEFVKRFFGDEDIVDYPDLLTLGKVRRELFKLKEEK